MPQVRYSKDGSKWDDGSSIKWSPDPELVKLVIGDDPNAKSEQRIRLTSDNLPANFTELYPKLTHLHLWGIAGLLRLPKLPESLRCLDVRGCPDLALLTNLPEGLEELLIESASKDLKQLPDTKGGLKELRELSFNNCRGIDEESFDDSIAISPDSKLQRLILSGTSITDLNGLQFSATEQFGWPGGLVDLRLSDMEKLVALAPSWPVALRRLEIKNVTGLSSLPDFPDTLDYIDIQGLRGVERLPRIPATARTLFIHSASLNLPGVLYGEENENKVKDVRGEQQSKEFGVEYDHEVKVILLGNGRCGKTSLAKALIGEEPFKKDESSTEGIELRSFELPFVPIQTQGDSDSVNQRSENAIVNVWDFAGQDLYHNTHRLFFQVRGVFVICETDHGKGWDEESDREELQADAQFEGQDRDLNYWIDQVRSLMNRPDANESLPIIFVRTKVDRDSSEQADRGTHREVNVERPDAIPFSAPTNQGVRELKRRLSLDIAKVLGTEEERQIGTQRKKVKDWLQQKKDAFQGRKAVGNLARLSRNDVNPYILREEFDAKVRSISKSEEDQKDPGIFLDRLHKSGFLFYSKEYANDYVILDQQWVIDGTYTIFNRKKGWPLLKSQKGEFCLSDLREWVWGQEGYTEDHQEVFLKFMEASGICFRILAANESRNGEDIFTAPGAWPDDNEVAIDVAVQRGESPLNGDAIIFGNKLLGRDAAVQLLVRLGRKWRRDSLYWKWGGQFRSYRDQDWASFPTFVYLNWTPLSKSSFGGALEVRLYGPDKSFLQAIVKEIGSPGLGFDVIREQLVEEQQELEIDLSKEKIDSEDTKPIARDVQRDGIDLHVPSSAIAKSVRVFVSYAGDGQGHVDTWKSIPPTSIERWPRAISAGLKAYFSNIIDYREEADRSLRKQASGQRAFQRNCADSDFTIAVLSREYFKSEYCMLELSYVYTEAKLNSGLDHRKILEVRAYLSGQIDLDGSSNRRKYEPNRSLLNLFLTLLGVRKSNSERYRFTEDEFRKYWVRSVNQVKSAIRKRFVTNPFDRILGSYNEVALVDKLKAETCGDWYLLVSRESEFEAFTTWLRTVTKKYFPVNQSLSDEEMYLQKIISDVVNNVFDPESLISYARRSWREHREDDAAEKFVHAVMKLHSCNTSQLKSVLQGYNTANDTVMDAIRIHALGNFDKGVYSAINVATTHSAIVDRN